MITVTAILLNYNSKNKIKNRATRLLSIQKGSGLKLEVLVVDNSQSHNLESWCDEKQIRYIDSGGNLGYAGGNNVGIQETSDWSDYIFVLNPDIQILTDGLIETLINAMEHHNDLGIAAPTVIDNDGEEFRLSTVTSKLMRMSGLLPPLSEDDDNLEYVDHVPGCSMLIGSDVIDDIGLFNEDFFLYLENIEFCFRAREAGYEIAAINGVFARHDRPAESLKSNKNTQIYYKIRNALLLPTYMFTGIDFLLAETIFAMNSAQRILLAVRHGGLDALWPAAYGIRDAIRNKSGKTELWGDG